jgi:hypothetical protein
MRIHFKQTAAIVNLESAPLNQLRSIENYKSPVCRALIVNPHQRGNIDRHFFKPNSQGQPQ